MHFQPLALISYTITVLLSEAANQHSILDQVPHAQAKGRIATKELHI